jgi:TonB-linked SusC/RagA family outer membrane protein
MKHIRFFLILIGIFLISSGKTWAQDAKITYSAKDIPVSVLLSEIEKQTNYIFVYNKAQIDISHKISVNVKDEPVSSVLDIAFKGTNVIYSKEDNHLILSVKKPAKENVSSPVARQQNNDVSGTVIDSNGESLPGVNVYVKSNSLMGTVTNVDGNFSMSNIPDKAVLVFSYVSYATIEIDISKKSASELKNLEIIMKEEAGLLEEVVVTATGTQTKVSVVGAITTVNPIELKTPTRSLSNQLAGRVAGVTFVQSTGQPGKDGASFIIRGINAIGGSSDPLILIDGLKRNLDDVDPNDIESFSVLKDASATAVYGLEGANGIVVIKTRSGKVSEKPNVKFSYSSSVNNSTYKPEWANAVDYAKMRNEALEVRGRKAAYTDDELLKFADNNMDEYPNVDWYNELFKANNFAQKGNINISGGGNSVSYYASGGFYQENGMFKGEIAEWDANANYSQFNFRSNLKADITSTTTVSISLDGRYNTTTEPGQSSDALLKYINYINPTAFPAYYSNGTAPSEANGMINPYSMLNRTGFARYYSNVMSTNLNVIQKLDMITPGLYITGIVSFTKENNYRHRYYKNYEQHQIDYANSYMNTGRDEEGNLLTINITPNIDNKMKYEAEAPTGFRQIELQSTLNYARRFIDDKLYLTGLLMYKQREKLVDNPEGTGVELLINALPAREQSLAGRIAFDWVSRYFVDINFGGSGSQMFTPDKRWSYFPSLGAGWLVSGENFWEPVKEVVDLLKIRASYGTVGSTGEATRFGYMASTVGLNGYSFGFGGTSFIGESIGGIGEARPAQLGLTWEKNKKADLGLELGLFNQIKATVDLYRNRRVDQLVDLNYLPATLGLTNIPKANLGEIVSEGADLELTYAKNFGDFRINYIRGVIGYNTTKIIEDGALNPRMPYQSYIGYDFGRSLYYLDLGLFKDQEDIDNSPVQVWNDVKPGDIKYKDINGDGVINSEDRIPLGNIYPKWTYSLAMDFSYKNWTVAGRIIGKSDMFRNTAMRVPFSTETISNVSYQAAIFSTAVKDHWTPESYSGTIATERANARYPRLATGVDNTNNVQASTFWLKEASYWRIADVEIGYNWIPKSVKFPFKSIYFYGRGENLHTFSPFKDWNPEQTSSLAYPLKMTVSLGLELNFKL